jgi:5-methyltetrahydropteroyltriglutamate--homocysteine methyltransferase
MIGGMQRRTPAVLERPLATTIAGSLPKPGWLAETERLWPSWRLDGAVLDEAKRDAVRLAVFEQDLAGIDVVTDGEQTRRHFVHGFLEGLEGIDRTRLVRRGIRADRYEADCPSIVGPIGRPHSVHADEVAFARTLTPRGLKVTLPGPMTIVDTLHDAYYRDRRTAAFAFADVIRAEIADLAAAGVDVVQIDEPAFNVYFDELEAWGIEALDRCVSGAGCATAVHVCYGYGIEANVTWKRQLGLTWDQYEIVLPMLARSTVDQIAIELAGSRVPPDVLRHCGDKHVAVGAIDVADDRVESADEVLATLEIAARYIPVRLLSATTNCGMAPMRRDVASAKLGALVRGAHRARERLA